MCQAAFVVGCCSKAQGDLGLAALSIEARALGVEAQWWPLFSPGVSKLPGVPNADDRRSDDFLTKKNQKKWACKKIKWSKIKVRGKTGIVLSGRRQISGYPMLPPQRLSHACFSCVVSQVLFNLRLVQHSSGRAA